MGVEPLAETREPRLKHRLGRRGPSLRLVQARKAGGRAQLPGECALLVRRFERFPEVVLRVRLRADLQRELTAYPERLGQTPAFLRPLDAGKRLVDREERRLDPLRRGQAFGL